jgi:hypothetical protein
VVGFLRVDQPVTAHRYRSPWRRNRGLARISRSSRSSRFSRRSRRSSSRSAVVSPSVRWPASRSAWRTHWRTAVSVRSSSLETWPTVLVLRMSSTTYALYSGGKNRRGRGIGMSTSRPTTSGSWPHVPGQPRSGSCGRLPVALQHPVAEEISGQQDEEYGRRHHPPPQLIPCRRFVDS